MNFFQLINHFSFAGYGEVYTRGRHTANRAVKAAVVAIVFPNLCLFNPSTPIRRVFLPLLLLPVHDASFWINRTENILLYPRPNETISPQSSREVVDHFERLYPVVPWITQIPTSVTSPPADQLIRRNFTPDICRQPRQTGLWQPRSSWDWPSSPGLRYRWSQTMRNEAPLVTFTTSNCRCPLKETVHWQVRAAQKKPVKSEPITNGSHIICRTNKRAACKATSANKYTVHFIGPFEVLREGEKQDDPVRQSTRPIQLNRRRQHCTQR